MASPLLMDLRIRVMDDLDSGMTVDQAADKYSITSRTIFSWKKLRSETRAVNHRHGKTGPSPKLEPYRTVICAGVKERPEVTLDELKAQLNLPGGLSTLWTALRSWGVVLKKLIYAAERKQADGVTRRRWWSILLSRQPVDRLVFIDETGASTKRLGCMAGGQSQSESFPMCRTGTGRQRLLSVRFAHRE